MMLAVPGRVHAELVGIDRLVGDVGDELVGRPRIVVVVIVAQREIAEIHRVPPEVAGGGSSAAFAPNHRMAERESDSFPRRPQGTGGAYAMASRSPFRISCTTARAASSNKREGRTAHGLDRRHRCYQ